MAHGRKRLNVQIVRKEFLKKEFVNWNDILQNGIVRLSDRNELMLSFEDFNKFKMLWCLAEVSGWRMPASFGTSAIS